MAWEDAPSPYRSDAVRQAGEHLAAMEAAGLAVVEQHTPVTLPPPDGNADRPLTNGTPEGCRHLDETADLHDALIGSLTTGTEDSDSSMTRALVDVLHGCSDAVWGATRWADPLEIPAWVHRIRRVIATHLIGQSHGADPW